jgi:tRNA threonylcarbamoyl adenosine modification protein YeaZ
MNILFFDTSQGVTSICASINGVLQPAFHDAQPSRQAELLVSQVEEYVAKCGMKWNAFQAIGCVNGIGGFTSVRIGVAAARGLAMAAGVQPIGIELMQIIAYHYFSLHPPCVLQCVIPAGNNFVAVQHFNGSHLENQPMEVLERQDFLPSQNMCVLPNIADFGGLVFPLEDCAEIAVQMLLEHGWQHLPPPIPLYARPADAKVGTPLLKTPHPNPLPQGEREQTELVVNFLFKTN